MRIAALLETSPIDGGAFQQALSTIELLQRDHGTKHTIIVFTPFAESCQRLLEHGIQAIQFRHRIVRHLDILSSTLFGGGILRSLRRFGLVRLGRHLDALFEDHKIDLVLLTDISSIALRIGEHPFAITVMDLDHIEHPEYPEHFRNRRFQQRDKILRQSLPRAFAIIADSHSAANRIAHVYGVNRNRIAVLPFAPNSAVRHSTPKSVTELAAAVRIKHALPDRYIFYPAYYLFHKNHLYVLDALTELRRRHDISLHAVFCGADLRGELATIARQARELGLDKQVHFLGLVPDMDLIGLYGGAFAVVSPSPFGPTNLQPIEAVALRRPVICADLPGCHEQMGDAALYCDLSNPSSLALQLANLIQNPKLVDHLRAAAERFAADHAAIYQNHLDKLIDEYDYVRRRWTWPDQHIPD